jgi:hypothetical protein
MNQPEWQLVMEQTGRELGRVYRQPKRCLGNYAQPSHNLNARPIVAASKCACEHCRLRRFWFPNRVHDLGGCNDIEAR